MDKYSRRASNVVSAVAALSIFVGLIGWWHAHDYIYLNIAAVVIGLALTFLSHDLAKERVSEYPSLNYKFSRGMYIFGGLVFIFGSVIRFLQDKNLF